MDHAMRAAIYCRLTSPTGSADNQLVALEQIAANCGWQFIGSYTDELIGIGPARSDRTALNELLAAAARREIDLVLTSSLDHLGQSLRQIVETVHRLLAHGVHLCIPDQLDTTRAMGPAMSGLFAALVGCERTLLRQRAKAGAERARLTGVKLGRPSNLNRSVEAAILALRERGLAIRRIAAQLGIGTTSVYRVLERQTRLADPGLAPNNGTPLKRPRRASGALTSGIARPSSRVSD